MMNCQQHSVSVEYIGWSNEGIEYWNGFWRRKDAEGFFDDIEEEGE